MIASTLFSVLSVLSVLKDTFNPSFFDPFVLSIVKCHRTSNFAFRISLFDPCLIAEKA
jgi:hypothetical protein